MTVYMAVTDDRYELPVAVADTERELARKFGVWASTVSHHVHGRFRHGHQGVHFCAVEIDDGQD